MELTNTQLIYFTGTGSTRTVGRTVAEGIGLPVQEWDCTTQKAQTPFQPDEHTITVLAVPSFGGRVPKPIQSRMEQLQGKGPVVLVSVYGARASDSTLPELRDFACEAGYMPVAAGAFVAKHSLAPVVAADRPNADDLEAARELGRKAKELAEILPENGSCILDLPGEKPYREFNGLAFHPEADDTCEKCGHCVNECPMGAISPEKPGETDTTLCITCMRCAAVCPVHGRRLGLIGETAMAEKLSQVCDPAKPNEIWLAKQQ